VNFELHEFSITYHSIVLKIMSRVLTALLDYPVTKKCTTFQDIWTNRPSCHWIHERCCRPL